MTLIAALTDKTLLRNHVQSCCIAFGRYSSCQFGLRWFRWFYLRFCSFRATKTGTNCWTERTCSLSAATNCIIATILQLTSVNYKITMDIIETKFRSIDAITVGEFYIVLTIWAGMTISYVFFIGGCIHYKENFVPLWVPFVDNDQEPSVEIFMTVWVYESIVAVYTFFVFTVYGPFIIVSTVCIRREIFYLMKVIDHLLLSQHM